MREYSFSPELLRMMLSEERQKFSVALGQGASWRELNQIRKTINQLNKLLDFSENKNPGNSTHTRSDDSGLR